MTARPRTTEPEGTQSALSGFLTFLAIVALLATMYLLGKSMVRHHMFSRDHPYRETAMKSPVRGLVDAGAPVVWNG